MFNICSPWRNIIFALSPGYLRSSLSPQTPAGSGSSPLAGHCSPAPRAVCQLLVYLLSMRDRGYWLVITTTLLLKKRGKFCQRTYWDIGHHSTYILPLHSDHIKAIGWWRVVGGGLCDISVSPRPNPLPLLPLWNLLGFVWTGGLRIRLGLGPDNNAFLSHQIAMWHRGTPRCVWVWWHSWLAAIWAPQQPWPDINDTR